ncbi:hypothetical protein ATANTOWER_014394 [Ataeniobius toweri]|uniref:Uncharacterized protein n=1 Tax=Ataeniobius toweri TaxID=208326 RepID=A0ABU7CAB9_9TELE|nr:hypothetical protein [Ataeniobius toweri]
MENQTDRMLIGRPGDALKSHWKVEAVKVTFNPQILIITQTTRNYKNYTVSIDGDYVFLTVEVMCFQ